MWSYEWSYQSLEAICPFIDQIRTVSAINNNNLLRYNSKFPLNHNMASTGFELFSAQSANENLQSRYQ